MLLAMNFRMLFRQDNSCHNSHSFQNDIRLVNAEMLSWSDFQSLVWATSVKHWRSFHILHLESECEAAWAAWQFKISETTMFYMSPHHQAPDDAIMVLAWTRQTWLWIDKLRQNFVSCLVHGMEQADLKMVEIKTVRLHHRNVKYANVTFFKWCRAIQTHNPDMIFITVYQFLLLCWCKNFTSDRACGRPFDVLAAYLVCISCQAKLVDLQFWFTLIAISLYPLLYNLPKSRRIGLMRLYCEKYRSVKAVRIASKITHFSHGEKSCIARIDLVLASWSVQANGTK